MAYLTAISGSSFGKQYNIDKRVIVLGRHPDCDVTIDVGAVSRQHAQIHSTGNVFELEDLKSRNGTFLNGQEIDKRMVLHDGDLIRICDVEFSFHAEIDGSSLVSPSHFATGDGSSFGIVMVDDHQTDTANRVHSKLDIRNSSGGGSQLTSSADMRLKAFLEITHNLARAVQLEDVLPKVLDTLFKVFLQADRAFIVL